MCRVILPPEVRAARNAAYWQRRLTKGSVQKLTSLDAMAADDIVAFFKSDKTITNLTINDCTSSTAARAIFGYLCSRPGRQIYLESFTIGKDSIKDIALGDIGRYINKRSRLNWLDISVPEATARTATVLFAKKVNKSKIQSLCLRDASDSFAEQFFPNLQEVARIDLRHCPFTSIGSQHIFDYLAVFSKLPMMEIVLSGAQFGFNAINAVTLRQINGKKEIEVAAYGDFKAISPLDQYKEQYWRGRVRAAALSLLPYARTLASTRSGPTRRCQPNRSRVTRAGSRFSWHGLPFELQNMVWQYTETEDLLSPRQLGRILEYAAAPSSLLSPPAPPMSQHVSLEKRIRKECEVVEWLAQVGCEVCETALVTTNPPPPQPRYSQIPAWEAPC